MGFPSFPVKRRCGGTLYRRRGGSKTQFLSLTDGLVSWQHVGMTIALIGSKWRRCTGILNCSVRLWEPVCILINGKTCFAFNKLTCHKLMLFPESGIFFYEVILVLLVKVIVHENLRSPSLNHWVVYYHSLLPDFVYCLLVSYWKMSIWVVWCMARLVTIQSLPVMVWRILDWNTFIFFQLFMDKLDVHTEGV